MDNNKVLVGIVIAVLVWMNWDKIKPEINIKPNIPLPTPSIPFPVVPSIPQPIPQPEPQPPGVVEPQPQPEPIPEPPKVEPVKPTGHWENRRVRTGLLRSTTKRIWVNNG